MANQCLLATSELQQPRNMVKRIESTTFVPALGCSSRAAKLLKIIAMKTKASSTGVPQQRHLHSTETSAFIVDSEQWVSLIIDTVKVFTTNDAFNWADECHSGFAVDHRQPAKDELEIGLSGLLVCKRLWVFYVIISAVWLFNLPNLRDTPSPVVMQVASSA